jgi:cell division septation protein DedD
MSAERKKLLWISISACVFVLLVLAVGFALLSPKKGGAQAPAAIANGAPPKAQDPQDFLSAPPPAPAPALEQPRNQDGGVIVVYGDKPKLPEGEQPASALPSATAPAPAAAAPAAPAAAGTAAGAATSNASSVPGKAASPAAPTVPAKAQSAAKAPAAKSASPRTDEFWIQAASFTSRGKADDLKQVLADRGIAALISVKGISSKSWYRVRVGPYLAKAEADGWLGRLKDLPGCAEAYVSKLTATKPKQ